MSKKLYGKGISHPNIALIKYWGKKDLKENIPTNSSLSFTTTKLNTVTEILENDFDEFYLNGKKTEIKDRMKNLIQIFKDRCEYKSGLKIVSNNNFAHGCGLASSASGFSALVKACNSFFNLNLSDDELSKLARFGSGSAARSLFSGFALFEDFSAKKIMDWEDFKVLVIVNQNIEKKVGSTEGMIRTTETSSLFTERLKNIRSKIEKAVKFIKEKNFEELMLLTMRESNELHAVILDSWPPVFYLNDQSFKIINLCTEFNENGIRVGYTFDAGPNAFIFTLERYFDEVMEFFKSKLDDEIIVAH